MLQKKINLSSIQKYTQNILSQNETEFSQIYNIYIRHIMDVHPRVRGRGLCYSNAINLCGKSSLDRYRPHCLLNIFKI